MAEMKYYPPIPSLRTADVHINPENPKFHDENRLWQGIPSIEKVGNRLWAAWYSGGPNEPGWGNFTLYSYSDDDGLTWKKNFMAVDSCDENCDRVFDPNVWLSPKGELFLTYAQTRVMKAYEPIDRMWTFYDGVFGTWFIKCKNPEGENPQFEEPFRMCDGLMMNKPTVLSTGEWVAPAYDWMPPTHAKSDSLLGRGKGEYRYHMRISADCGKNWDILVGPVKERYAEFDESMFLEGADKSWHFFVRVKDGVDYFYSDNRGETWEKRDLGFKSASSRFFVRRLASGKVLFVCSGPNRIRMEARLSSDDCKTWSEPLIIDEREKVSYPDGTEDCDGNIYIAYDCDRYGEKEILFAKFTEADIEAKAFVSEGSFTKRIINKLPK